MRPVTGRPRTRNRPRTMGRRGGPPGRRPAVRGRTGPGGRGPGTVGTGPGWRRRPPRSSRGTLGRGPGPPRRLPAGRNTSTSVSPTRRVWLMRSRCVLTVWAASVTPSAASFARVADRTAWLCAWTTSAATWSWVRTSCSTAPRFSACPLADRRPVPEPEPLQLPQDLHVVTVPRPEVVGPAVEPAAEYAGGGVPPGLVAFPRTMTLGTSGRSFSSRSRARVASTTPAGRPAPAGCAGRVGSTHRRKSTGRTTRPAGPAARPARRRRPGAGGPAG